MNEVVSALYPARGRPYALRRSALAFLTLAARPERVELLFRFDADDPHLQAEMGALSSVAREFPRSRVVVIVGERFGYVRLYEYFNELATISRGAWLLQWNDDTHILTPRWDELLFEAPPVSVQLLRRDVCETADPTFPATGRPVYEAMGHISLNAHCDAWVSDVSWWAKCQVLRNDIVFHHDCLADQTAGERVDDMDRFKGPEQTALRAVDIERVKARMVTKGIAR